MLEIVIAAIEALKGVFDSNDFQFSLYRNFFKSRLRDNCCDSEFTIIVATFTLLASVATSLLHQQYEEMVAFVVMRSDYHGKQQDQIESKRSIVYAASKFWR